MDGSSDSGSELGSDPEPDELWDFGGPKLSKEQRRNRAKLKRLRKRTCFWPSPTPMNPEFRRLMAEREPKPPPSPDDSAFREVLRVEVARLRKLVEEIAPEMLDSFPEVGPSKRQKLVNDENEIPTVADALNDSCDDASLAWCTQQIEKQFEERQAKRAKDAKKSSPVGTPKRRHFPYSKASTPSGSKAGLSIIRGRPSTSRATRLAFESSTINSSSQCSKPVALSSHTSNPVVAMSSQSSARPSHCPTVAPQVGVLKTAEATSHIERGSKETEGLLDDDNDDIFLSGDLSLF